MMGEAESGDFQIQSGVVRRLTIKHGHCGMKSGDFSTKQ
jgi:hypothetical protein